MAQSKSSASAPLPQAWGTPPSEAAAVCAGCGGEYPRRETVVLHEENHDDMVYFHGQRLCRRCADRAGVIR